MLRYLPTRPSAILGALLAIFGIVCTQVPLLNTLGYEFSAAAGLLIGLAGGFFAIAQWRRTRMTFAHEVTAPGDAWRSHLRDFAGMVSARLLLLFLPLGLLAANAWLVPNCAPLEGLLFFLLIPCFTAVFITALGVFCAALFRSRGAYAAMGVALLLLLIHPVLQILTQPQLYAYNHLFGMFTGFSWDETQPVFGTLALYRLTTLAYAGALLAASFAVSPRGRETLRAAGGRGAVLSFFAVSATVAVLGVVFSDDLGFSTSARALQGALSETRHTEHFVIRCAAGSFSRRELDEVAEEHEFRLAQVCRDLGVRWEGRIGSYVYPDNIVKRRLLGTESSEIARPWMREIHLSREGWRDALKHELVHVVASAFGPYIVRTPVFRAFGLTEGLAMAVEWDAGNRTPHQLAAAMLAQDMLPHAGRVISTGGFLTGASFSGYVASGSFCRWLIDAKGLAVMKDAYARDDVEAATGLSLERLDGEWRGFLRSVRRELPDSATTVWLFRRQSLFTKACPRAVTEKNREAAAAVAAGDDARAVRLFREADAMAPNPRAVYGMASAFLRMGRVDSALALTARMLADSVRGASLLPLWLWRGDAEWKRGNTAGADSCYARIERERPGGWVEAEAREKRALIALPVLRDAAWRVYDLQSRPGADRDSVRAAAVPLLRAAFRADSSVNLSRLLLARRLRHDTLREAEAVRVLRAVVPGPFFLECSMLAGDILLGAGDIRAAEAHYERALAAATMESERLAARDALERCAWKLSRPPGIP